VTDDELKRLQQHFDGAVDRLSAENRHFFQLTAESLRHEIKLVAEGVSSTREALDREAGALREEVRRTATLQSRVDRLEGSTH